jgi:hypothetical protein
MSQMIKIAKWLFEVKVNNTWEFYNKYKRFVIVYTATIL